MNTLLRRLLLCLLLLTTQQSWAWSSLASASADLVITSAATPCPHHDGMEMTDGQAAPLNMSMTMDHQGCSHDGHCQCAHAGASTPVPTTRPSLADAPATMFTLAYTPGATLDPAITPLLRPPAHF